MSEADKAVSSKTQILYVAVILVVAAIVSTLLFVFKPVAEKKQAREAPPLAEYLVVRQEQLSIPVFSQGTIVASKQIKLVAEVNGRIAEVASDKFNGGFFNQGDMLVKIEPKDYQLSLTRTEAKVAAAEQQLARVEIEAEQARFDLKQIGRDASSSSAYALRKPHLAEAKANLRAARADYEIAQLQLKRTEIRAPFNGRVVKKHVDAGQYVGVGSVLADIYSSEAVEVGLPLSLEQTGLTGIDLRDSQAYADQVEIKLHVDYGDEKYQWQARLSHIESELDARNRLVKLVARVEQPFNNAQGDQRRPPLTPGMFVKARITGLQKDKVIRAPRSVLRANNEVWLVDKEDRLQKSRVELYAKDESMIYIKSGLKSGDRVILNSIDYPLEGMGLNGKNVGEKHQTSPVKTDE